jgi:6-phosphogluconolactonase
MMLKVMRKVVVCAFLAVFAFAAGSSAQIRNLPRSKSVFVMNNDVDRNEILVFRRAPDGTLHESGTFPTGGRGSGGTTDPLQSQGSLTLSQDGGYLFAVNAASGDISAFAVLGPGLVLIDRTNSGGAEPNAIAQHGDLVYVVNAAGTSNVVGFRFDHGRLRQIPNSTRLLSTGSTGASSLAFSPNGRFLVVTERTTNNLDVFAVESDGSLSQNVVTPSVGPGVFAVSFAANGAALVSETGPAGVPNGSAASSYALQANSTLTPITASIPTLGAANCWNAVTPNGRFFYVSNSASATISGFAINNNGSLTPVGSTIVGSNPTGATNLDIAVSADGTFLYTLNSGNGTIGIFRIETDGTLAAFGSVDGIERASGFNGIAAN